MSFWIVNALLNEKESDNLGLTDLLPIEVLPELYDLSMCMILANEDALKAREIYETIDIVELNKMLAIKNALNYHEDKNELNG